MIYCAEDDVACLTSTASVQDCKSVGDLARALGELQRLNGWFEIALNNMARGLSMFDDAQRLIVCNKTYREIYGLPESLTRPGTPLADIIRFHVRRETGRESEEDVENERKWIMHHVAELARGKSFAHTQHLKDGRVLQVTNQPLPEGGWVDLQEDVTEKHNYAHLLEARIAEKTRELAEQAEELKRSNSELERFAYIASHDLQEPLRMVASYTQLLGKRYAGKLDADADEFIRFAVDGATRMRTLIDDLLAYSRVSTKGKSFEAINCDDAVDSALANLRAALGESGATVSRSTLPTIIADGSQLVQVFQNLIGNALKFRRDRTPEVRIGAERTPEGWTFSVEDNGIGIKPEYIDQLFVLFKRLHSRAEYPGTGLGLAICKRIIERHGGRIWVTSTPGQGTTFSFSLPDGAASRSRPNAVPLQVSA